MPAKDSYTRITLALDIVRRIPEGPRAGYHELNVIKHRIDLHDTITVEPSGPMRITCTDPSVPLDSANLCWKAVALIQKRYAVADNVHVHIEKRIPVQGGLAGGSANAATVMLLLSEMWGLALDTPQLCEMGRDAGMDVPYYFVAPTCFDTEAAGMPEPVDTRLKLHFVLLVPSFGVSTRTAYGLVDTTKTGQETGKTRAMRNAFLRNDRAAVLGSMHNDFEPPVFAAHPALVSMKRKLLDAGCEAAVMSGSGSTLVGIAESRQHAEDMCRRLEHTCIAVSSWL